jgi:outer membrane protein, multidrug efflux system
LLSFEVDLVGPFAPRNRSGARQPIERGRKSKGGRHHARQQCGTQYFTLRELDAQLGDCKADAGTRQEALNLTTSRRNYGIATDLDVKQAEQLVDTADVTISNLQQQIEQTENQITLLLGENPGRNFAQSNFR